jgi:MFS transporter, FHS family, L-fucose permease
VIAIFVYVGAEVAIGSLLVSYMSSPEIGGLTEKVAGERLSIYWFGAMVGRFFGSAVMRRVSPGSVLAFNAACAIVLLIVAIVVRGQVAMWLVLAIGLCNSIMFPTIFALAIARLGPRTGEASGLANSFFVPAICYAYIVYYGLRGHRIVGSSAGA